MPEASQPKKRGRKPSGIKAQTVRLAIHPAMVTDLIYLREKHGWGGATGDLGDIVKFVFFREMARLKESGFIPTRD